jgi:hypothetical protein
MSKKWLYSKSYKKCVIKLLFNQKKVLTMNNINIIFAPLFEKLK